MLVDEVTLAGLDESVDEPDLDEVDRARSSAIAAAFAAAWLMSSVALDSKSAPDVAGAALEHVDFRLRRIATTEVATAYSTWHTATAANFDGAEWVQRWDATLDRKICEVCARMDGEIAAIDIQFVGGLTPGLVHVGCRCMPTIIPSNLKSNLTRGLLAAA